MHSSESIQIDLGRLDREPGGSASGCGMSEPRGAEVGVADLHEDVTGVRIDRHVQSGPILAAPVPPVGVQTGGHGRYLEPRML
jgi:hypothetical protein